MKKNLAEVIKIHTGVDISESSVDVLLSQGHGATFGEETIARGVRYKINPDDLTPEALSDILDQACMAVAKSTIRKFKNLKYVDEGGQVDYQAFMNLVVNVPGENGLYLRMEDSGIQGLDQTERQKRQNVEQCELALEQYRIVKDPIKDFMLANDIATVGEAIRLMGLL